MKMKMKMKMKMVLHGAPKENFGAQKNDSILLQAPFFMCHILNLKAWRHNEHYDMNF